MYSIFIILFRFLLWYIGLQHFTLYNSHEMEIISTHAIYSHMKMCVGTQSELKIKIKWNAKNALRKEKYCKFASFIHCFKLLASVQWNFMLKVFILHSVSLSIVGTWEMQFHIYVSRERNVIFFSIYFNFQIVILNTLHQTRYTVAIEMHEIKLVKKKQT